jgi:hypothetical protein
MDGWLRSMHVVRLFRDVFGERREFDGWIVDLENDFANRVYLELFPMDIEAMNVYMEIDEDPFNGPIPISGWRIPYDYCDVSDLDACQQTVAELLVAARLEGEGPDWLRDDAPDVEVERNLARIAALPGPIAGLADLIRLAISRRAFGNPFLDYPFRVNEFDFDWEQSPYYWTPEDIGQLAALYREARPVVERIQAFEAWFAAHPGHADGDVRSAILGPERLVEMAELAGAGGEIADD